MKKALIVIDMQNDFIDGSLGTPEALSIVSNVKKKIDKDKENLYAKAEPFKIVNYFRCYIC